MKMCDGEIQEMEFEVEPCLEPKYCAVCWWWAWIKGYHRCLKNAVILLNGVPVCEKCLPDLLKGIYGIRCPGAIICSFFEERKKELEKELEREFGRKIKLECEATEGQWNLRARLKVTMKEQSEEG